MLEKCIQTRRQYSEEIKKSVSIRSRLGLDTSGSSSDSSFELSALS